MATEWRYRVGGVEYGPLTANQLRSLAEGNRLSADDLVQKGSAGRWVRAANVRGLFEFSSDCHEAPPKPPNASPGQPSGKPEGVLSPNTSASIGTSRDGISNTEKTFETQIHGPNAWWKSTSTTKLVLIIALGVALGTGVCAIAIMIVAEQRETKRIATQAAETREREDERRTDAEVARSWADKVARDDQEIAEKTEKYGVWLKSHNAALMRDFGSNNAFTADWDTILAGAHNAGVRSLGSANRPSLEARIHSQSKYQERLKVVGPIEIVREEQFALSVNMIYNTDFPALVHERSPVDPHDTWFDEVWNRWTELGHIVAKNEKAE